MQTRGHTTSLRTAAAAFVVILAGAIATLWDIRIGSAAAQSPALSSSPVILLLVEDRGCPYCARWDREVGPAYARSPEGRFAPLVRRFRGSPDVDFLDGVVFSPTFVVLKDGKEVGRIVGYAGPDFFWSELSAVLHKAGFPPAKS